MRGKKGDFYRGSLGFKGVSTMVSSKMLSHRPLRNIKSCKSVKGGTLLQPLHLSI